MRQFDIAHFAGKEPQSGTKKEAAVRLVATSLNSRLFVEVTAARGDTSLCGFPPAGNSELTDFHVGLVPKRASLQNFNGLKFVPLSK